MLTGGAHLGWREPLKIGILAATSGAATTAFEVSGLAEITVYGATWCGDCRRAKRLLDEHAIAYDWVDIDADPQSLDYVRRLQGGGQMIPTIVFADGSVLVEPTTPELAAKLGVAQGSTPDRR